jgi:hypothetical protein
VAGFLLFFKLLLAGLSPMRLLFVAFAISFCALLWVAFSVARHILRHPHPSPETDSMATKGEIKDGRNRL